MNPPPFKSSVKGLKDTPPEVVHHVLNDLRVFDILRLANSNEPSIDNSILSHRICGKVFHNDFDVLHSVRDHFHLYQDVCRSFRLPQTPADSFLSLSVLFLPTAHKTLVREGSWVNKVDYVLADHRAITKSIVTRLAKTLNMDPWHQEILARYAAQPENLPLVWDNFQFWSIKSRWEEIQASQKRINALKIDQLKRAARLLEANPDILKQSTDPEQKRRSNLQHRISRMDSTAEKLSRSFLLRDKNRGSCFFRYKQFPIVPFDAALDFVAEKLEQHGLSAHVKQLALADSNDPKGAKSEYNDLSPISHQVNTLISETSLKDSPKKAETQSESEPERKAPSWVFHSPSLNVSIDGADESTQSKPQKACFVHEQGLRQPDKPQNHQPMAWEPYDEKELKWLEAFVEAYRYFDQLSKRVNS